jgi:hypothetical protein
MVLLRLSLLCAWRYVRDLEVNSVCFAGDYFQTNLFKAMGKEHRD